MIVSNSITPSKDTVHLIPRRLIVLGTIFIVLGAESAIGMFLSIIFERSLTIDFTAFLIPIGFGILKGSYTARTFALCGCWISYLLALVWLLSLLFFPQIYSKINFNNIAITFTYQKVVINVLLVGIPMIIYYGVHKQLNHPEAMACFLKSEIGKITEGHLDSRFAERAKVKKQLDGSRTSN